MTIEADTLHRALGYALDHLSGLDTRPVAATTTLDELRARLGAPLGDAGLPATAVVEALVEAARGGHLGSASGRFFAWVIGGALPSAIAADWLTSVWDNNATIYATGPAASVAEDVAGAWARDLLGLPATASFALTTGCQMAHVTCLAAARHTLLAPLGWDVGADGLAGAPPIRVLANAERHASIERALRLLGIGTRALVPIEAEHGRIAPASLEAALRDANGPTIVVLGAGDLNVGAFDRFEALIPMAHTRGAWVHVDGAFGLWARASERYRHLADGVELADSWATDAHKWLNTPQDCGLAFVADPVAHKAAMTIGASYMSASGDARDAIDWTPDWTRRARGFALWAALRELGRDGVAALIDRCCAHAAALAQGIAALGGAEMVAAPVLNQALVRFPDPNGRDDDISTNAVIAAINAGGEAFFGGVTWGGQRAMRISVVNWRTTGADVARTIRTVEAAVASVRQSGIQSGKAIG